jgi:hypothetical protein
MILFTYYGGIEAVVWVEVLQLGIYIAGAIAALWVLAANVPGGLAGAVDLGRQYGKFTVFDFGFDLSKTYTFWSGVVGGCFLTMSTHGTDQYMVQRYLCTDRPAKAGAALLASGVVVLVQFVLFLLIGVLLFAFYRPFEQPGTRRPPSAASRSPPATACSPTSSPSTCRPVGRAGGGGHLRGRPVVVPVGHRVDGRQRSVQAVPPGRDDRHYLTIGKGLILLFGVVQTGVALAMMWTTRARWTTCSGWPGW